MTKKKRRWQISTYEKKLYIIHNLKKKQIKMRYYYIPIKMPKLQNTTSPNAGKKVEKQELSITVLDKVSAALWKAVWKFLEILNIFLQHTFHTVQ